MGGQRYRYSLASNYAHQARVKGGLTSVLADKRHTATLSLRLLSLPRARNGAQ